MSEAASTLKEWALYVYMCADVPEPGMHRSSQNNLRQMLHIGSSKDVWVVAQIAEPDRWTYRYIFPERDPTSPVSLDPIDVHRTVDSASPRAVKDFFAWASDECPAKKIMMVAWGHGYGLDYYVPPEFHTEELTQLKASSPFATLRFTDAMISNSVDVLLEAGSLPMFDDLESLGMDRHARNVLLNNQIGEVSRSAAANLPAGQKLAILGFDACEMALAEVWSEMQETAAIGIASEASLPFLSWPYDLFLEKLLQQPTATPEEVTGMLMTSFSDYYAACPSDYVTLSAVDLTAVADVNAAVKKLASALKEASIDPAARQSIFAASNDCPQYDTQGYIDFGCFCKFLGFAMPNTPVSVASNAALEEIEKFVIASTYSPARKDKKISQSTGIAVWMPDWIENANADAIERDLGEAYLTRGYAETQFAVETGWDQFLSTLRTKSWGIKAPGSRRKNLTPDERMAEFMKDGGTIVGERDRTMGPNREMGPTGEMGPNREMGANHEMGAGQRAFQTVSSGAAGVVLHAAIDPFGPRGDVELNFTVRWSAATLAAAEASVPARVSGTTKATGETRAARGRLNDPASDPVKTKATGLDPTKG